MFLINKKTMTLNAMISAVKKQKQYGKVIDCTPFCNEMNVTYDIYCIEQ